MIKHRVLVGISVNSEGPNYNVQGIKSVARWLKLGLVPKR